MAVPERPDFVETPQPSQPVEVDHGEPAPEPLEQGATQAQPVQPSDQQMAADDTIGAQVPADDTTDDQQTIQVPADQATLHKMAHGDPSDAQTWWAVIWERIIKRAIHFGRRVIVGGNPTNANK